MEDKIINEKTIQCGCGMIITGINKNHAKFNLKQHKKSEQHKKNMRVLK